MLAIWRDKINSMTFRIFVSIGLLVLLIVLFMGQQNLTNLDRIVNAQIESATSADTKLLSADVGSWLRELRSGAAMLVEAGSPGSVVIKNNLSLATAANISALRVVESTSRSVITSRDFLGHCPVLLDSWPNGAHDERAARLRKVRSRGGEFNSNCIDIAIDLTPLSSSGQSYFSTTRNQKTWLILTTTNDILKDAARSIRSGYVTFYDHDGQVIARSGKAPDEAVNWEISRDSARRAISKLTSGVTVRPSRGLNGTDLLVIFSKGRDDDLPPFAITIKPDALYLEFNRAKVDLILYGVLFLLIAILMSFAIASKFSRPIRDISMATKEIAQGNFSIRIKVDGVNEITTLAGSVNDLSTQIEDLMSKQRELGRISAEVETAQLVQETLFPGNKIMIGRNITASAFAAMASECGGDLWGAIQLPGDKQCVYIGDASGHGVPAAFITIAAQSSLAMLERVIHARGQENIGPDEILGYLNKVIADVGRGKILMSMFVAVIDNKNKTIAYANAGHTKPIVISEGKSGEYSCQSLMASGMPLGFSLEFAEWRVTEVSFSEKEKLVLFTDGFTENVQNLPTRISKRDIFQLLGPIGGRSAEEICRAIETCYTNALNGAPAADDCTIVVMERLAA